MTEADAESELARHTWTDMVDFGDCSGDMCDRHNGPGDFKALNRVRCQTAASPGEQTSEAGLAEALEHCSIALGENESINGLKCVRNIELKTLDKVRLNCGCEELFDELVNSAKVVLDRVRLDTPTSSEELHISEAHIVETLKEMKMSSVGETKEDDENEICLKCVDVDLKAGDKVWFSKGFVNILKQKGVPNPDDWHLFTKTENGKSSFIGLMGDSFECLNTDLVIKRHAGTRTW